MDGWDRSGVWIKRTLWFCEAGSVDSKNKKWSGIPDLKFIVHSLDCGASTVTPTAGAWPTDP
eukprot:scaffold4226_cov180-Amphora_coffeaeformis.AAC.1